MNTEKKLEYINSLILKFLDGQLTSEEKKELVQWLASSKSNKDYFKQLYLVWKGASVNADVNENELSKAFRRVQLHTYKQKIRTMHSMESSATSNNRFLAFRKWVAVILISLVSGAVLYYMVQQYLPSLTGLADSEIVVPFGSKSRISLPDGSTVWLNAGSKLTYTVNYGKKLREVNLTGEGYFKVAHRPAKPFIVHASKVSIKALGTEFNVKAYPDEDVIETILVKGSVEIDKSETGSNKEQFSGEQIMILRPGQKARIYKKPEIKSTFVAIPVAEKTKTDVREIQPEKEEMIKLQSSNALIETSWKDDRWIIKGKNLDDLLVLLSRRFNVSISLLNNDLSQYQFSGTIENETPEQVFKIMSLTIPMSYSIEKGKVNISLNRELEEKYKAAYKKVN
ncbi:MAG: FecR family protein [Bacteroidales bacterium]|nr:FecR family protein [Bacteroidales bacterium]